MVDSNTLVFLHFDNDVCKDECGHTFTSSNILLESNHKKVGTHSAYFHDAGTLYCDKPGFSIGGADFTIDFWVYVTSIGRYSRIYNVARSSSWIECMCHGGANKGTATDYSIRMHGDSPTTPAWAVAKLDLCSKWTHYAVVYEHSKTKRTLYIDGKAVLVSYHEVPRDEVISIELMNNTRRECSRCTTGYMDEFRISSCARWTSDFTPPTSSYEYTWGGAEDELQ